MPLKLFKVFVVLRVSVSVFALSGVMLGLERTPQAPLSVVAYVGLLVLLGVTTAKLFRLKPDALGFASALLIFETVGAFLFPTSHLLSRGSQLDFVAIWAGIVLIAWGLPNTAILWWAKRRLFIAVQETRPLPHPEVRPTQKL